jgi:tetratricopeptide (TPR) repeat protein
MLVFVVFLLAGCGERAAEIPPPPGLEEFDTAVQVQYRERRAALEEALARRDASDGERAGAYGSLGNWYNLYEFFDGAELSYKAAIGWGPEEADWPYFLAHIYNRLGRRQEARDLFRRVLELEPDNVPARLPLAQIEHDEGESEAARLLYQQALALDPACVLAMLELGTMALERGELREAVLFFERAEKSAPGLASIRYSLGRAYRQLGDGGAYLSRLATAAVSSDPIPVNDPRMTALHKTREGVMVHFEAAVDAYHAGRHQEAIEEFRLAIAADFDNLDARLQLGLMLNKSGRGRAALREMKEAVARFPAEPRGQYYLAFVLADQGQLQEAEAELRVVIEENPNYTEAKRLLASVLSVDAQAVGKRGLDGSVRRGKRATADEKRPQNLSQQGFHASHDFFDGKPKLLRQGSGRC